MPGKERAFKGQRLQDLRRSPWLTTRCTLSSNSPSWDGENVAKTSVDWLGLKLPWLGLNPKKATLLKLKDTPSSELLFVIERSTSLSCFVSAKQAKRISTMLTFLSSLDSPQTKLTRFYPADKFKNVRLPEGVSLLRQPLASALFHRPKTLSRRKHPSILPLPLSKTLLRSRRPLKRLASV